jgi:hypothetical protein
MVPQGKEYHLAPFSIQKSSKANIYGVIFGSSSIRGREKFLEVCWDKDQVTGEANFNIDKDCIRNGQPLLWSEANVIKKRDLFEKDMIELLKRKPCSNLHLYRFCLENGFLPKHANEILRELQKADRIEVADVKKNAPARKGAFYLAWEKYKTGDRRITIRYKDEE